MACAAGQSYAAAGISEVSISYGDIPVELVEGTADQENAGETVSRSSHIRDAAAGIVRKRNWSA